MPPVAIPFDRTGGAAAPEVRQFLRRNSSLNSNLQIYRNMEEKGLSFFENMVYNIRMIICLEFSGGNIL